MTTNGIDLSILTRCIERSETETNVPNTKITGDTDTDQKINDYFNRKKTSDTATNPTDTLAEVFAKYDTNHDGKISRSEGNKAGMSRSERNAFNKAMKAFGGDDGKIKSNALNDGSGTMYTKNGKFLFSIQQQNGDTVTTLYNPTDEKNNNKPTSRITENQNYTKTEENFNTDGNAQKTTYKYTDAHSVVLNGRTSTIIEDVTDQNGKTVTTITHNYENNSENIAKEVIVNDTMTRTYTDGNTKTLKRNELTGDFEEMTAEEPDPVADEPPAEESAASGTQTFQDLFTSGETKIKVSSEVASEYNADVTLPENVEYTEDGYPKSIKVKLPSSYREDKKYMNLTYDEETHTYKQKSGREFKMEISDGNISLKQTNGYQGRGGIRWNPLWNDTFFTHFIPGTQPDET